MMLYAVLLAVQNSDIINADHL